MLREFALPDLGEGLTESEIVTWHVAVGDTVALNQVIADVETAKATVELPSPFAGTITALHAEPGRTVAVGAPLLSIDVQDAADDAPTLETPEPTLVGYGAKAEVTTARRRRRTMPEPASPVTSRPAAPASRQQERRRSTPPVRRLARSLGIDLEAITGTGELGRITRDDLTAASASPAAAAPGAGSGATGTAGGDVRIPISGIRKATAAAMVASAFTAPHVTEFLTIDVTESVELLDRLRADPPSAEHRLTILTVVAKAVCIALARTPALNSRWDDAAQQIVQLRAVNLGIAAATERGLIVPNIRDAGTLTFTALAAALGDLTEAARAGTTTPATMRDGTFTITNIGVFGIDAGTPILNPGEAGILAIGAVRRTPWEHDGAVALRQVMTLSLSFDHRVVDGAEASRFLADVGAILRDPARVLSML